MGIYFCSKVRHTRVTTVLPVKELRFGRKSLFTTLRNDFAMFILFAIFLLLLMVGAASYRVRS